MKKAGRPKAVKSYCNGDHVWREEFNIKGQCTLYKKCMFCDAELTREEFFKNNMKPKILRMPREVKKVNHIEMWIF